MLLEWKLVEKIYVIGFWRKGLQSREQVGNNRELIRVKLPINTLSSQHWAMKNSLIRKFVALLSILIFRFEIFKIVIQHKPAFLSVHNPTFLPIAILMKLFVKCKVVYVPHELESKRTGINFMQEKYVVTIESLAKRWLHHTVFVSPEIEKWYRSELGYTETSTIRNIPINPYFGEKIPESRYLKDFFRLKDDDILFIYQGIINQYRGIETLLDVFMNQQKCHIVFMGFGELTDTVIESASKSKYVHYHPAVEMQDIIKVTSSADVSLFFVDTPITKSYELTTANKFYEGIIAGTPFVISNNFSYMSDENQLYNLGWSLPPQKTLLEQFIKDIDRDAIESMKKNCLAYGSKISWKEEAQKLKFIYDN